MRTGGSGSGGREGGLWKGKSEEGTELGMDGARETGEGERAEERGANERGRGATEESGRDRDREGGTLRGMYPDEDTGQYTVYIAQNSTHRGPCP